MEVPEGYKEMMIMVFSVHAKKPADVRDKYEGYLNSLLTDQERQSEYSTVRLQAFQMADANNDGVLDEAEWGTYCERMASWQDEMFGGHNEYSPEQIKHIFDQISKKSGSITKEAFIHNMQLEGYVFGMMVEDGTFKKLEESA